VCFCSLFGRSALSCVCVPCLAFNASLCVFVSYLTFNVVTLTLGSRLKQRFTKVQTKNEAKMTFHAPETIERCEVMNSHIHWKALET